MSQSILDPQRTFVSTNDLSAAGNDYKIAKVDTANSNAVVLAAAATDPIIGVFQSRPKAGQSALIRFAGTSKVRAGGTITRGDKITTDSAARGITASVGNNILGIALESAVSGDVFEVLLDLGKA